MNNLFLLLNWTYIQELDHFKDYKPVLVHGVYFFKLVIMPDIDFIVKSVAEHFHHKSESIILPLKYEA